QGFPQVVDVNVGGSIYTTSLKTLTSVADSLLAQIFSEPSKLPPPPKDSSGRYFLDRDGVLFRYVLDFLRSQKLSLPENFAEYERLKIEADHFRLPQLARNVTRAMALHKPSQLPPVGDGSNHDKNNDVETKPTQEPGYVVLGYRGTFAVGRDGLADVKFRKLARLLVSGQVRLCREAFGETLNESRDPDRGSSSRYTNRFFLKHNSIEQAFDNLQAAGFRMVGATSSGTSGCGDLKPGMDSEESRWNHYNEFVFAR
ncbi:BTB/POZ domain-containing protein KCTD8, partial [Lamellibrachia satsuma]